MLDKRHFLAAAGVLPVLGLAAPVRRRGAPALITVAGRIARSNRGPSDPLLEPLLKKHGVAFDQAFTFDAAALARLPSESLEPTLEYDAKPHRLAGPLLSSVLAEAGADLSGAVRLGLRAVDGYRAEVAWADARAWRMVVATHMDGKPLGLGGLGPQWAVYDADRLVAFSSRPLAERFAACPWGLYLITVDPG